MHDTGYLELDCLPARTANAYIYDEEHDEYYTNIYNIDAKGTGAGGVFMTVLDIDSNISITIVSNMGNDVWDMHRKINEQLLK